jgi:hypothetical protein
MRRLVCAALIAASAAAALPRPAEAWWGPGGFVVGTALGVATGAVIGSAIVRPYAYYPYPYAYPYYPAPVYAVPYGYPPPVAYYPAPAYPVPAAPPPAAYVAPAAAPAARTPSCPAGQFFNTYTGNCDRR